MSQEMKKTDPHDALAVAGLKLCGPFDVLGKYSYYFVRQNGYLVLVSNWYQNRVSDLIYALEKILKII